MNAIDNILVIVDPTADTQSAVKKAALLAQKAGARLELYACDTRASRESRLSDHSGTGYTIDLKALLERLATPLRERGIDVATESDFGDPLVPKLIDKLRRTSADLVVKDTHHHSLAQRTFLTNTDWELIRSCPVPLLLVKSPAWTPRPKIVAAVDPGHVNDKPAVLDRIILDAARILGIRLSGEVHALHAYIPVTVIASAVGVEPPSALAISAKDLERNRQAKLREVSDLVAACGVMPDCIHVQTGGPAQVLPHAARELHADVVVMGALSRRGLKRVFIGSTAEDVLERLPCDALIVKLPDFSDALAGMGL